MGNRKFYKGDKVICSESEVVGTVLRFYSPTSCEEQTMVKTDDKRLYHAPTRTWVLYKTGLTPTITIIDETDIHDKICKEVLNKINQDMLAVFGLPEKVFK